MRSPPTAPDNPPAPQPETPAYQARWRCWRAAEDGLAAWELHGLRLAQAGSLALDFDAVQVENDPYAPGSYQDRNFYNGRSYRVGQAISPPATVDFDIVEAIASWNVATPDGAWVEVLIQAQLEERWTKWYNLGVWASGAETVARHSVRQQQDADGKVAVDTLVITRPGAAARAARLKLRLFSVNGATTPQVHNIALALSTAPTRPAALTPGNPALWGHVLDLPACSQMVYPDGGRVWCSPTATAMLLGYWGQPGSCETRVRQAVVGVYDWVYNGHGNWPFNTAYAHAALGLESYVARFTSLAQAEPWIAAGVPLIVSLGWKQGELDGAPIPSSSGHLMALVGFNTSGDPFLHDPAAPDDASVRRVYARSAFERLWLQHSGGAVYVIFPPALKPSLPLPGG